MSSQAKYIIRRKIKGYNRTNRQVMDKYFGANWQLAVITPVEVLELLQEQNYKCAYCNLTVLVDYQPHCYHQFSFDRHDYKLIYSKDNTYIICIACSKGYVARPKCSGCTSENHESVL